MNQEIKEELEDITLHEELMDMSIEEIMQDGHFNRETATAIYEAEHNIDMDEPMTAEEFCKWLDSLL